MIDKFKFFCLVFGVVGGFGEMVLVEELWVLVDVLVVYNEWVMVNWVLLGDVLFKLVVKMLFNFV